MLRASDRLLVALRDAIVAGDLRLQRVAWWRVALVRVWWWVWPSGLLAVAAIGFVMARAEARGRLELSVWLFAIIFTVGMAVLVVMYRRSQPRDVLCRLALPGRLVTYAKLASRGVIEPRVLSTPVVFLPDQGGLGLREGEGVVRLRELGVVLELSCSPGGRIGWCSVYFAGAADRASCAGRIKTPRRLHLFELADAASDGSAGGV